MTAVLCRPRETLTLSLRKEVSLFAVVYEAASILAVGEERLGGMLGLFPSAGVERSSAVSPAGQTTLRSAVRYLLSLFHGLNEVLGGSSRRISCQCC